MKKSLFFILIIFLIGGFFWFLRKQLYSSNDLKGTISLQEKNKKTEIHPLSIESLKTRDYQGSEIKSEEKLNNGVNYEQYIASYQSDGLKIYGLLTIPRGEKPKNGWPAIVFNHGYIPPRQYKTTERYVAYVDYLARQGYVVFKIDYRGHGQSEGEPEGAYGSNAYTIDVLNAVVSLKKFPFVDKNNIGLWGHSLGGYLTLRAMVVDPSIKAGVIWAGVVGSHIDLINNWFRRRISPPPGLPTRAVSWRQQLITQYGDPNEDSPFWRSISANFYLNDLKGAIQLHHAKTDEIVPYQFSEKLYQDLIKSGKKGEIFLYDSDDHNISQNFDLAMKRTVEFFDRYLKGGDRDEK